MSYVRRKTSKHTIGGGFETVESQLGGKVRTRFKGRPKGKRRIRRVAGGAKPVSRKPTWRKTKSQAAISKAWRKVR